MVDSRRLEVQRLRARFSEKYEVDSESGCWIWNAATNQRGTGIFGAGGLSKKGTKPAPVMAYVLYRDEDFDLDANFVSVHLCGRLSCVNPDHLALLPTSLSMEADGRKLAAKQLLRAAALAYPELNDEIRMMIDRIEVKPCS